MNTPIFWVYSKDSCFQLNIFNLPVDQSALNELKKHWQPVSLFWEKSAPSLDFGIVASAVYTIGKSNKEYAP